MMKKITTLFICVALLLSVCNPVFAAAHGHQYDVYRSVRTVNGLTIETEVVNISQNRATDVQTYQYTNTLKEDGTVIAVIVFTATFVFNGVTVGIMSKSVTRTDTYDGWTYDQISFTGANGTVTLTARLVKGLIRTDDFSMSIICDKDGNVSYI